jgi:hypothetical protein
MLDTGPKDVDVRINGNSVLYHFSAGSGRWTVEVDGGSGQWRVDGGG